MGMATTSGQEKQRLISVISDTHLWASGLTFFDDDVTEFFSPHAAGRSVMFLVALGKTVMRIRVGAASPPGAYFI